MTKSIYKEGDYVSLTCIVDCVNSDYVTLTPIQLDAEDSLRQFEVPHNAAMHHVQRPILKGDTVLPTDYPKDGKHEFTVVHIHNGKAWLEEEGAPDWGAFHEVSKLVHYQKPRGKFTIPKQVENDAKPIKPRGKSSK